MEKCNIKDNYIINEQTLSILPARSIEYQTKVIERKKIIYVKQTPFEIIKESCLFYWSSFEGRRTSTIEFTGYKEKVPIPIYPLKKIIAFPTHGIHNPDCAWLMQDHILQGKPKGTNQTSVLLSNGEYITIDISFRSFKTQFERAFELRFRIFQILYRDLLDTLMELFYTFPNNQFPPFPDWPDWLDPFND